MKILEKGIDRPLPIFLAAALVVLLGFWCLADLPVNRAPDVEIPLTLVVASYVGATPENIETELTLELEEQLNTLEDLRHLTSISSHGISTQFLEFEDRTDMSESLRDVQDKVALAEAEFPDDADAAVVQEISFDNLPIVFFTLRGGDLYRLRELAEDLEPVLESVPGVSRVEVFGGLEREVHIQADPALLAEFDLTLADLAAVLGRQGESRPAGQLHGGSGDRLIRATGEFRTLEEIRSIHVRNEAGGVLVLGDVAQVTRSHVRRTSGAWLDAEPSVTLIVKRRPDVNTLETVERLRARVDELRATLPLGVTIEASSDSSVVIRDMIEQLGTSAAIGLALVVLVLLFVFGVREAVLVGSVLPFSLLFTFIGLRVFDMEISNIALFALILVLGLVVDGAIIVGEAIHVEREAGADPIEAAKAGIGRVGLAVLAADLTTVAAFLPMLLMVGVMGQFMSVMPKVVTFALVGSVFVDHFLLPAAAARMRPSTARRRRGAEPGRVLGRARDAYLPLLERVLARRGRVVLAVILAFAAAMLTFASGAVDSIFLPRTDRGRFTINYALPLGSPLSQTNDVGLRLVADVEAIPELERTVLTTGDTGALSADGRDGGRVGPEYGRISVELVGTSDRDRSQSEIVGALRETTARYAGVEIDINELTEGPGVGAALAIRVKGASLEDVARGGDRVKATLASLPAATDVRVDYDEGRPEVAVALDRERAAARHGITPDQVSGALLTAFHGIEVGRMWLDANRVDLRLQAEGVDRHTVDLVRELPMRAADGSLVPLGAVASVELDHGHNAIFRHDAERTVTVRADALEGASSVELERTAREALERANLPSGIHLEFGGETEERDRSYASLWSALKWAVLLIYLIMAVQFDSLRQPLIVICAVPLSLIGVTLGLLVTGTPFSFLVFIGIVSLTGIVVNDGIVLVDAINRNRREGMDLNPAILTGAKGRFRPVLLTTVTTIAGLLPLTLNVASGGEFWVPLGIAVISGLLVASMLTLFAVPALYCLLEDGGEWNARARAGLARHGDRGAPAAQPEARS